MTPYRLRSLFLFIALLIVVGSVLFTNNLAGRLAQEEQKKVEIWAEATRELILADENTDIDFFSSIIEGNTTIPVYMVDGAGNVLLTRNVKTQKTYDEIVRLSGPIEVRVDSANRQYIYYEESTLLRSLKYFPYIQFGLIFIFIFIAVITLFTAQRSEQNRVWVGLSKETAHQLGTPISSLNAWNELLKSRYPDDELLPQMDKDIYRLQTIAERFSKVGSKPELETVDIVTVVRDSIDYMRSRSSNKVSYAINSTEEQIYTDVNRPLFAWVVENLCKNALDAMPTGEGSITVHISADDGHVNVDFTDTGKGMPKHLYKTIFQPGYTSKKRGWGLGLSLAKRIVEEYHEGRIFVKQSQVGVGTTFRVSLKRRQVSE